MPYDQAPPSAPKIPIRLSMTHGDEIRCFADSMVQADMDRVLAALPPDHHIAVVANVNLKNANGAIMFRKPGSDWSFVAAVHRDWGGDIGAGATVRWSR